MRFRPANSAGGLHQEEDLFPAGRVAYGRACAGAFAIAVLGSIADDVSRDLTGSPALP